MVLPDGVKPYNLTFETRDGYLYAYVEGEEDSYDISRAFWLEIAEESKRLGIPDVLVDENIVANASMAEVFQLAAEIPAMGFGRVAFVDRYLSQNDVNAFGELVANNRGMNGKVFNDLTSAEAWLVGKRAAS